MVHLSYDLHRISLLLAQNVLTINKIEEFNINLKIQEAWGFLPLMDMSVVSK